MAAPVEEPSKVEPCWAGGVAVGARSPLKLWGPIKTYARKGPNNLTRHQVPLHALMLLKSRAREAGRSWFD